MTPSIAAGRLAVISAALALACTGCGDGANDQPSSATSDVASSPTTATSPTESTAPTPSPSASPYSSMGAKWNSSSVTVQVFSIRLDAPSVAPADSGRWGAMDVKYCNIGPESAFPSWSDYVLFDAGSGQYPSSSTTYNGMLTPEFPFAGDRAVRTNSCVRGWVYFDLPKGKKISGAAYAPADGSDPHLWLTKGSAPPA